MIHFCRTATNEKNNPPVSARLSDVSIVQIHGHHVCKTLESAFRAPVIGFECGSNGAWASWTLSLLNALLPARKDVYKAGRDLPDDNNRKHLHNVATTDYQRLRQHHSVHAYALETEPWQIQPALSGLAVCSPSQTIVFLRACEPATWGYVRNVQVDTPNVPLGFLG